MTQFTLNLLQGSAAFPFNAEAAGHLQAEIGNLMQSLKAIAARPSGQRPQPQPSLDYRHVGEVVLELFCNPNIYPSPFAAKVLVVVRDERIRLNAEAELTRLIEDLNQYLEQAS